MRKSRTAIERLLELVDIFTTFTPEERAAIAAKLKRRSYDEGETLVEPGIVLQSLFIIGNGVVSITRDGIEGDMEVLRLGPGDHFGEIGMLTGARRRGKDQRVGPRHGLRAGARRTSRPSWRRGRRLPRSSAGHWPGRQAAGRLSASPELDQHVPKHRLTDWFSDRIHRLYDVVNVE